MKKGEVSNFLRKAGLLPLADKLRFHLEKYKNRKANREFRKEHPKVPLPPDYLIYESFQLNYKKYYTESVQTAKWLTDLLSRHTTLEGFKILDWGCGPGRIIRHLDKYIGADCKLYGTDYNEKSIQWCSQNLPGILFNNNKLEAELPYPDEYFDVVYGISIFTHMSGPLHFDWYRELIRVLKPGGIFLFTTQGNNYKVKLVGPEKIHFENGELVVRGNVTEGHRIFSAFHPTPFVMEMIGKEQVLEHIEQEPTGSGWLPQDVWIIKKESIR